MSPLILALILGLTSGTSLGVDGRTDIDRSELGVRAAPVAATPGVDLEVAATRYAELEAEFRAARSAINAAKGAVNGRSEPSDLRRAYVAKMQTLCDAGYGPAIAWVARRLEADAEGSPSPKLATTDLAKAKLELYRRILPAHAGAPWVFDDELDLIDSLTADAGLLGPRATSDFAGAIFAAEPPHPFEHRLRALTLEAEALAPLGEADLERRQAASEVWRRERDRDPNGPFARFCDNALWRLRHFAIGQSVPDFAGTDIDGNQIRLSDFEGKVIVVSFFSFERTGDRARAVSMHRLASQLESAPFALVGVDQDPKPTLFRKLWEELELRFPCVFEGGRSGAVATTWHLDSPPRNLVIDRTGKLRHVDLDPEALERVVDELTSEPVRAGDLTTTTPRR
jgi:peroxiredoxin